MSRLDWEEIGRMDLDGADVGRLTAAQKECLRLVMAGFKTKEIAYRLGIGVDAVNKRLAGAKATLGSPSRFHAARLLASHESAYTYHYDVGSVSAVVGEASVVEAYGNEENVDCYDGLLHGGGAGQCGPCPAEDSSSSVPSNVGRIGASAYLPIGHHHAWTFAIATVLGALFRLLVRS